jgi:TonB family protein
MRITTALRPFGRCFQLICFLVIGVNCSPAFSQTAAANGETPAAMPSDPRELMLLAAKSNGLTGEDVQPWHLKATYRMLDEQGNATDNGTYEEIWVSPNKFKRTFTGAAFTQTDYGTEKGILRSGAPQLLSDLIVDIRSELVSPMPDSQSIEHEDFDLQPRDASGTKLVCIGLKGLPGRTFPVEKSLAYCLAADKPILRIAAFAGGEVQALHNRILSFHGHFIAGDLQFVRSGKLVLSAHLETIESLGSIDDAIFTPPPDATLLPRRVTISGAVAQGFAVQKTAPVYPPEAKKHNISGTVVIEVVIGRDGHLIALHPISGPPFLQQAALDAVRSWVYRPYLLDGEPVEVDTTINVVFQLGGRL